MLSSAIALRDGLALNREVFNQFGPIVVWIQRSSLELPVSPALAIRLVTVLQIVITVVILADIGRRRNSQSPITQQTGILASITWLVLSDIWLDGPMRPWPVFTTITFLCSAAYLLQRAWRCSEFAQTSRAHAALAGCGLLMTLAAFCRIVSGLVFAGVLLACALVVLSNYKPAVPALRSIGLGGILGLALTVSLILIQGDFPNFIQDTLIWPFEYWKPEPSLPFTFALRVFPVYLPAVLLGVAGLLLIRRLAQNAVATTFVALCSGLTMLLVLNASLRFGDSDPTIREYYSLGRGILLFFSAVCMAIAVCLLWLAAKVAQRKQISTPALAVVLLALLSALGLAEVPPDYNVRHIWWSLPIGLLLLYTVIPIISTVSSPLGNPLFVPLLVLAAYASTAAWRSLEVVRVSAPAESIAAGMLVRPNVASEIKEDVALLQRTLGPSRALFLSETSDLAVLSGHYSSIDKFFTCHSRMTFSADQLWGVDWVVFESKSTHCPPLGEEVVRQDGFAEVGRNSRLRIYSRR